MTTLTRAAIRAPILTLIVIETVALAGRSWLKVELSAYGYGERAARDLSYLAVPLILLALALPILRDHRPFLARRLDPRPLSLSLVSRAVAIGVLMRLAWWSQLVASIAFGFTRSTDPGTVAGPLFAFACPPPATLALYLLVMSLLVPVIEETVNRGFFLHGLLDRGTVFAVLVSSALFAVFHRPDAIGHAFVIGIVLAVLALRSGSLWPSMIAHAAYNGLIALDWLCLQGMWNPPEGRTASLAFVGAAATAVFAASAGAILRLARRAVPAPYRTPTPPASG